LYQYFGNMAPKDAAVDVDGVECAVRQGHVQRGQGEMLGFQQCVYKLIVGAVTFD
jgi:hypothetical protein